MPTIEELTAEVETLRKVNLDLLTKKAKAKDRIAALETSEIELRSQLDAANLRIKTVGVERPVARLMRSMSAVPDVLAEQLAKSFQFESGDDGELHLMNTDGTPALKDAKTGVALPVDESNLREFLCPKDSRDASAAVYAHLLTGSKASGGGTVGGTRTREIPEPLAGETSSRPQSAYGLR